MIEYTENDIKEIWEALSTLILKCAEKKQTRAQLRYILWR